MKAAFRTDASLHIGTGHVTRCLTLADALAARTAGYQLLLHAQLIFAAIPRQHNS